MQKLVLIEWNEVNAEIAHKYVEDKNYKNLKRLFSFPSVQSTSEDCYDKLEPWIQWVSVHTGQKADEHGVFRLGDIEHCKAEQIFEKIENLGYKVGVISAMNAKNNLSRPSFFIPDPWTKTSTDGSFLSKKIYDAISQAVNDNAKGEIKKSSYLWLLVALLLKSNISNWKTYVRLALSSRKFKWRKALFLDLLLTDIFMSFSSDKLPDFSTLFLNGFAHVQHHYMFNSKFYQGTFRNPSWYISEKADPLEDALVVYDKIFGMLFKNITDAELIIATGLRQVPYTEKKYMYRLRNHVEFLNAIGIKFHSVFPRMTSDFVIYFESNTEMLDAINKLENVTIGSQPLFNTIDKRENSLFVMSDYPHEITKESKFDLPIARLLVPNEHLVFVALKNGKHDANGTIWSNSKNEMFLGLNEKHVLELHNYILNRFSIQ